MKNILVKVDYGDHHLISENWTELRLHCPECGVRGIWVFCDTYICTHCAKVYMEGSGFEAFDIESAGDNQRYKQLKQTKKPKVVIH